MKNTQRKNIEVYCAICNKSFFKRRAELNRYPISLCSKFCTKKYKSKSIETFCKNCTNPIIKHPSALKKNQNNMFCNSSCAAKYNNAHKTKGTKRSKLEIWIQDKLSKLYPNLKIQYNDKYTINSELDIYIPSLKLAFELNGIFHYEPIYGEDKLKQIENNDQRKFQACLEKQIELCIIDTSSQKRVTDLTCQKYLDIIVKIIKQKLM